LLAELRDAEVNHLHQPIAANDNILRLDISMHYSGGEPLQSRGHLNACFEDFVQFRPPLPELVAQGLAIDQLGGNEVGAAFVTERMTVSMFGWLRPEAARASR
jgi:hypothetical protein